MMYSAFADGELHGAQLLHRRLRERRGLRERVDRRAGDLDRHAEAPHEPSSDREGEGQIDLLGAHRAHQHLEGPG